MQGNKCWVENSGVECGPAGLERTVLLTRVNIN